MKINGQPIQSWINDTRARWNVPGVSVAVRLGEESLFYNSGFASLDPLEPFTEFTSIPIGSVTKPLIGRTALSCVKKGLASWETPVCHYAPDLKFAEPAIREKATIADFLSMRTGLGGDQEWDAFPDKTNADLQTFAGQLRAKAGFRKTFLYSSFSIAVAASILESATGRSWPELVKESLAPLELKSLSFSYQEALKKPPVALGYKWDGLDQNKAIWQESDLTLVHPGASLCLSASDLLRWISDEALDPTSILFQPHILTHYPDVPLDFWPEAYGLCWGLRTYRGHSMIYHRGSDVGFRTVVAMIPDADVQIAITSNGDRNLLIHLLLNHVLDEVLGHSYIPWEPLFEVYAKQTNQR